MIDNSISIEIPIDSTDVHLSNHCLGVKSDFAKNNYYPNNFDSNGFFHALVSFGVGYKFKIKDERLFGVKRVVVLQKIEE